MLYDRLLFDGAGFVPRPATVVATGDAAATGDTEAIWGAGLAFAIVAGLVCVFDLDAPATILG